MFANLILGSLICCTLITNGEISAEGDKILLAQTMRPAGQYAIWIDGFALTKDGTITCTNGGHLRTSQIETTPDHWQVRIRCEKK